MNYYLLFDIGGTAVKYAVSNEQAEFVKWGSTTAWGDDIERFLDELEAVYRLCRAEYPLAGIAVSAPGFVDPVNGVIHGTSALPCIHEYPIAQAISKRMGGLPVAIENDGNCGGLGEYWKGNGQGLSNIVMIVCGSGIGGGYVQNGRISHTTGFSAAEYGFMPIAQDGGIPKCWSAYSVVNTTKRYNREQNSSLTAKELFDRAPDDKIAAKYVDEFYYYLALGSLCIGFALDPDIILFGGEVSRRPDFLSKVKRQVERLTESVKDLSFFHAKLNTALLHNDANICGALYHFLQIGACSLESF